MQMICEQVTKATSGDTTWIYEALNKSSEKITRSIKLFEAEFINEVAQEQSTYMTTNFVFEGNALNVIKQTGWIAVGLGAVLCGFIWLRKARLKAAGSDTGSWLGDECEVTDNRFLKMFGIHQSADRSKAFYTRIIEAPATQMVGKMAAGYGSQWYMLGRFGFQGPLSAIMHTIGASAIPGYTYLIGEVAASTTSISSFGTLVGVGCVCVSLWYQYKDITAAFKSGSARRAETAYFAVMAFKNRDEKITYRGVRIRDFDRAMRMLQHLHQLR